MIETSMPHTIPDLQWFVIMFMGAIIIYFLKKKDKSTDEHEKALRENTFALVKLSCQMEIVLKQLERLPEIERDLSNLGQKVRSMSNSYSNNESND